MDIIIPVSGTEKMILESWLGKDMIQPWLQHALNNKIRQRIDASIVEASNLNPSKMNIKDKLDILKKVKLPTREERDDPGPAPKG
ncbi:MAG: hypothetical protein JRI34_04880 [Deltaproteobacteria bacterium]|nr:hypothetical protein [Deltaproteobacteria bacterium]